MYEGEKFLLKLYRELYAKESVKHSGDISDNKYELINKYLNRLEKTEKIFLSNKKEVVKYLKNRYYDKYVIKRENISSSREDTKDKIIKSQQETLDMWLDYLMTELNYYPMWVRYWTFQGMLQLGQYDKDNKKFTKRSKKTTAPFIDLNKEALIKTMDLVIESVENNDVKDIALNKLIKNGSFSKLYAYYISKQIEEEEKNRVEEGIWGTYRYNYKDLAESLREYNTGWCLTSEAITKNYLEYGPIHIYYTKDKKGEYTVPRICIRQEDITVAEVKGVYDSKCNLEYSMIDIAIEKLDQIHGGENFKKIGNDIKKLTKIAEKDKKGIPLSTDDLIFIYEINGIVENFTFGKDYRIKQIIQKRNIKEDLSKIFNCSPEKICIKQNELIKDNNYYIYYGDIYYQNEEITVPQIVIGNISLENNKEIKGFEKLEIVTGSIKGEELQKAENFKNLKEVIMSIEMPNLKDARGFEKLERGGKTLNLLNLENLNGLNSLKETGNLDIDSARSSKGLESLEIVRGTLDISNMIDLRYFESLKLVEKNAICYASNSLYCVPDLKVNGNIHFYHMINIYDIFGRQRVRKR